MSVPEENNAPWTETHQVQTVAKAILLRNSIKSGLLIGKSCINVNRIRFSGARTFLCARSRISLPMRTGMSALRWAKSGGGRLLTASLAGRNRIVPGMRTGMSALRGAKSGGRRLLTSSPADWNRTKRLVGCRLSKNVNNMGDASGLPEGGKLRQNGRT